MLFYRIFLEFATVKENLPQTRVCELPVFSSSARTGVQRAAAPCGDQKSKGRVVGGGPGGEAPGKFLFFVRKILLPVSFCMHITKSRAMMLCSLGYIEIALFLSNPSAPLIFLGAHM